MVRLFKSEASAETMNETMIKIKFCLKIILKLRDFSTRFPEVGRGRRPIEQSAFVAMR